ncbi:hypothetical protein, partial [Sulfuricurvum sp.]
MNKKIALSVLASIVICNIQLYAETEQKELSTVNVDTQEIEDSTIGSKNVASAKEIKIFSS